MLNNPTPPPPQDHQVKIETLPSNNLMNPLLPTIPVPHQNGMTNMPFVPQNLLPAPIMQSVPLTTSQISPVSSSSSTQSFYNQAPMSPPDLNLQQDRTQAPMLPTPINSTSSNNSLPISLSNPLFMSNPLLTSNPLFTYLLQCEQLKHALSTHLPTNQNSGVQEQHHNESNNRPFAAPPVQMDTSLPSPGIIPSPVQQQDTNTSHNHNHHHHHHQNVLAQRLAQEQETNNHYNHTQQLPDYHHHHIHHQTTPSSLTNQNNPHYQNSPHYNSENQPPLPADSPVTQEYPKSETPKYKSTLLQRYLNGVYTDNTSPEHVEKITHESSYSPEMTQLDQKTNTSSTNTSAFPLDLTKRSRNLSGSVGSQEYENISECDTSADTSMINTQMAGYSE